MPIRKVFWFNIRMLVDELGHVVDLIVHDDVHVVLGVVLGNILVGELLGHLCGIAVLFGQEMGREYTIDQVQDWDGVGGRCAQGNDSFGSEVAVRRERIDSSTREKRRRIC